MLLDAFYDGVGIPRVLVFAVFFSEAAAKHVALPVAVSREIFTGFTSFFFV